jgi:hypothetical protein
MAAAFLANLDPNADRFTFQLFGDGPNQYAEVFHGTLDQFWPKVLALNTTERLVGVFVTINETDLKGRRKENIVRPRAHFVDADNPDQIRQCMDQIEGCGANPSMVVNSGRGRHFYWLCSDTPLDQFSSLQESLIDKLRTDKAIHDLPRVMRLPGTLHLKERSRPRLVELCKANSPTRRWNFPELVAKFGLSPQGSGPTNNVIAFKPPEWAFDERPAAAFPYSPIESLSAGLEPDIEEVRSAVSAIPPAAIATEPEWMHLARALAYVARIFPQQKDQLWEILDTASKRAPGYDEDDNRSRFNRYIGEALNHPHPITLATVFHMAHEHGWPGPHPNDPNSSIYPGVGHAGPNGNPNGTTGQTDRGPTLRRAVHISSLPLIPPKRQWLHGADLIRGAVTVLAAPGGRAKSTWLLTCALACASGRALLGSHVFGGPLRVLCLSTEDGMNEMALRLRAAQRHYGLTDADVPGLYVIAADQWGLPLLRGDGYRAVLDDTGIAALRAELDHMKPDILIIDPLITVMGGTNANDNATAALLMRELTKLAVTRGIAVALAHHTSKGREVTSADSAMGAASFINLARIALAIEPLDPKDAGTIGLPPWDAWSVFRVLGTKQNFSAPNLKDTWFRLISVGVSNAQPPIYMNGDQVAVVEPFVPGVSSSAFPHQLMRDALTAIDGANPPLTPSKRSPERYAAPVLAQVITRHRGLQASELHGKAILDHLMRSGFVVIDDVKLPRSGSRSDTRKGLIVTPPGKAVMQQTNQPAPIDPGPQSPQTPANSLRDDAGGDLLGPPQPQGGYGGNAGPQ